MCALGGCAPAVPGPWPGPPPTFSLAAADEPAPVATVIRDADAAPPPAAGRSDGAPVPAPAPPAAGGPAGGAPPAAAGRVVDRQGHPIEGAVVLFADGVTARTDADGRFTAAGPGAGGFYSVAAAGYATSFVAGGERPATLHLERLPSADAPHEGDEFHLRGTVAWPEAPPLGGTVQYRDDLGSLSNPVVVDAAGGFSLRVITRRAGRPSGRLMALAAGADGSPMMGFSAPVALRESSGEPLAVTAVKAARAVAFAVPAPPAGLDEVTHRLEFAAAGIAPFVMLGAGAAGGTYRLPEPAALGAITARLVASATNAERTASSVLSADPYALPTPALTFLPPPTVTVEVASRAIAWDAPGTGGARLAIAAAARPDEATWEGWFDGARAHRFAAADWPAGAAIATLTAFDGPEATARHVAGLRPLRLLPAGTWAGGYRHAHVSVPFTP